MKRVVLFKNGVGYFEHVGTVHGNESVTVGFTSGQLNDVLKSLTVLDLHGGRITGVAYSSAAPLDRQLGDLRLPAGEKTTLADFLGALRGAKLEVRNGASVMTGRLLSTERKSRTSGGVTVEVDYLSLISDSGELRTTEISPSFSVRLLEPGLSGKVNRFLDVLSTGREADVRQMVISTAGAGDRSLYVSYISEVPVWKSTYRLVLNTKQEGDSLLQGWAIIDNVVGEDWKDVDLSLVAGAPQSFIQNLSKPYYAQRPSIGLPESVSTTPQTYESTLIPSGAQLAGTLTDSSGAAISGATVKVFDSAGSLIGQATSKATGAYEIASLPEGPIRLQVEAPGFSRAEIAGLSVSAQNPVQQDVRLTVGNVAQTVEVQAAAPAVNALIVGSGKQLGRGSGLGSGQGNGYGPGFGSGMGGGAFKVGADRARTEVAARSQVLGDLFEYKLKDPITILKNRSALVPIVQTPITVEKVSVWNEKAGLLRPQRALWITNSTSLTLDGGSISILEDETFAGEGIFDPIRSGEKRLLSYATDLAVITSSRFGTEQERVSRVRIYRGTMTQESEIREKKTYTFRNEDGAPRTIIVEHPLRAGYELRGSARPVETTADWLRFRLPVQPKQTASLVVEEAHPTQSSFMLTALSSEQLTLFVNQRSIDHDMEITFRQILEDKNAIAQLQSQKRGREEETQTI
ncbi:MAG: carboxypeptidase regulatory-like domain-containing protein, partial [Acidobacteriaceae bacterium]|nr:carboxypeptidase regulatory-like domain-containing protein [Acidobacteriaceae bacterium]